MESMEPYLESCRIKANRRSRNNAIEWTVVIVAVFGTIGFFLKPLMIHTWQAAVVLSLIIFIVPAYFMRWKTYGRSITGGMEWGPLIALGILLISWSGAISAICYYSESPDFYLYPLLAGLGITGIWCSFIGLKEGPVFCGWD